MDGGVYRRGQLRHGRARGTADGPNGTEIRRVGVRAAHVRRMDADIVRSAGERDGRNVRGLNSVTYSGGGEEANWAANNQI